MLNHHQPSQPSSTIINHHQPASTIINHHQPSGTASFSSATLFSPDQPLPASPNIGRARSTVPSSSRRRWHLRGPERLQFWSPDPRLRSDHLRGAAEGDELDGLRDGAGRRAQQGKPQKRMEALSMVSAKSGDFTWETWVISLISLDLEGLKLEEW